MRRPTLLAATLLLLLVPTLARAQADLTARSSNQLVEPYRIQDRIDLVPDLRSRLVCMNLPRLCDGVPYRPARVERTVRILKDHL